MADGKEKIGWKEAFQNPVLAALREKASEYILDDNIFTGEYLAKCRNHEINDVSPNLKAFCDEIFTFKAPYGERYSVEMTDSFTAPDNTTFYEPYLSLLDNHEVMGKLVGMINIRVGMPVSILTVQGYYDRPQIFYQQTGKFFSEVLIDCLIDVVAKRLVFGADGCPWAEPKIVFQLANKKMRCTLKNRLANYYLRKCDIKDFCSSQPCGSKEFSIPHCFFARSIRNAQAHGLLPKPERKPQALIC